MEGWIRVNYSKSGAFLLPLGPASKTAKTINASIIYPFETKIVPPSKDPSN